MAPAQHKRAPLSTAPLTKRLHISGLAPSIKSKDLVDRFSSFGEIVGGEAGVAGLGTDANGFPKTYAFLTIETSEAKLNKCTSMLSGALWKGHKLRIAPAREDYQTRLAAERAAAVAEAAKPLIAGKKRKRNPDPNVGYQARRFELVTPENVKQHRGWTLESKPVPAPLFPLVVRPSHPLPDVPRAATTSWTREAPKAKASKAARAAMRAGAGPIVNNITRARRVRIDPRKWGRKKVVFENGKEGWVAQTLAGTWECEDEIVGEGDDAQVRWVFKAKDGTVRRREMVRLSQRSVPHTDRFTALLEGLNRPAPVVEPTEEQPIVEEVATAEPMEDFYEDGAPVRKRAKSLSPPPYIPAAQRTLLYNEEDTFALMQATLAADELEASRKAERDAQLKVVQALLQEESLRAEATAEAAIKNSESAEAGVGPSEISARRLPLVEGFAEEDDDDDEFADILRLRGGDAEEEEGEVMRLRGGAGGDDSSSESEDGEDVEMTAEHASTAKPKTTLAMGSLKDMFKPKEADSGFSLLSGLDLELEPLERTPSPPPVPVHHFTAAPAPSGSRPSGAFVPPPALGRSNRAWVGTGPVTPFFAFPSGAFEDQAGNVVADEAKKLGLDEDAIASLRAESAKRLGDAAAPFWKSESMEEIEAQHQKLRESLRGLSRKRHREAAKRERKKGGAKRNIGGGHATAGRDEEA